MSKLKHAALALAAAGLLSVQAYAEEAPVQTMQAVPAAFSQSDVNAMFEQAGQPMQLAALSGQEMRETEGAWWPIFFSGGAFFLSHAPRITQFGMNMVNTSAYQPLGHAFNWVNTQRTTYWPNSRWW